MLQQRLHLFISQAIVDEQTISTISHHPSLAQHPQLLGDVGLRPIKDRLQMAHARRVVAQLIKNLQSHWVRKQLEQIGCFLVSISHR